MSEARGVDVLVLGAGVAAVAAVQSLRASGCEVGVIGAPRGASQLAGPLWDLGILTPFGSVRGPRETSFHWPPPFGALLEEIDTAHAAVRDVLPWLAPLGTSSVLAATDRGTFRRSASAMVPTFDLDRFPRGRFLVPALPNLIEHDAHALSRTLDERAVVEGDPRRFVSIDLEFGRRRRDLGAHMHEIAALLDDDAARARLAETLVRAAGGMAFDGVLLPPILGLTRTCAQTALEEKTGMAVGELVATRTGTASRRLADAIDRALASVAVRREEDVAALSLAGDRVRVTTPSGELEARAVVLATGRFLGGGVGVRDGLPVHSFASVPLFACAPARSGEGLRAPLDEAQLGAAKTAADPIDPGLFARLGLHADTAMRVLASDGAPISDRLFAAGAALADVTTLGLATLSGFVAGREAARRAKSA